MSEGPWAQFVQNVPGFKWNFTCQPCGYTSAPTDEWSAHNDPHKCPECECGHGRQDHIDLTGGCSVHVASGAYNDECPCADFAPESAE